jgi:hypothetical protein
MPLVSSLAALSLSPCCCARAGGPEGEHAARGDGADVPVGVCCVISSCGLVLHTGADTLCGAACAQEVEEGGEVRAMLSALLHLVVCHLLMRPCNPLCADGLP